MLLSANKKAFTLIELLIVVTLIALLSVALIATIKPTEQKAKASDSRVKALISEIFKAHLRYSSDKDIRYFSQPVSATAINSPMALNFIQELIFVKELRENILSDPYLNQVLLTAYKNEDNIALCYLPKAKSNQGYSSDTRFDSEGYSDQNCQEHQCYYCLVTKNNL